VNASRELDHVVRPPVDIPARPRPRRDVSSSRQDFSVAISRALGTIVVTVHGALDGVRSGELRRILGDLIGRHDNRDVVVDLRDMTVADGAHLKLFVDVSRHAWERGGHLTLSGPCHAASEAFARAGLTEALDVQPSGSHRPLYRPGS
jgi:anti-anti-sigma factor